MNRRDFLKTGLSMAAFAGILKFARSADAGAGDSDQLSAGKAQGRPNIIFILADDLGFETLGAYGAVEYQGLGKVRTPNLDNLAKEGMLFEKCFATPVCSPARSEVMTGKYNFRTGFRDIAGRNGAVSSLDCKSHPTIAATLKSAGYTTAIVGKWHLGPPHSMNEIPKTSEADTDYPHPRECGFDRQCILGGAHLELYGDPGAKSYTPAVMQDWCLHFLESQKGAQNPFFVYYASPIPHFPVLPTPLNPEGTPGKKKNDRSNFPYLIEYLDRQVGEIIKKLDELGMRKNTLVMFSGDNGTDTVATVMRDGRVIKGGKHSLEDVGSQVPLLANWPGIIVPGSVYGGLVDFTDIMPTCLELAGTTVPAGLDGVSFARQLQGKTGKPREWVHTLFVNKYFVRDSAWKLRENGDLYDVSKAPYEERLVLQSKDTPESKAARERLLEIMARLHPEWRAAANSGR